jgi:hypothetical protein
MFRFSIRVLFLGIGVVSVASLLADDKPNSPEIKIGRPIAETTAILGDRKIRWNLGDWPDTAANEDIAEVDFDLNKEMVARVLYSKTDKTVAVIRVVVWLKGEARGTRRSFDARRIQLETDGGYSIQFLPDSNVTGPSFVSPKSP